jgi:streptomycin 6-kinase
MAEERTAPTYTHAVLPGRLAWLRKTDAGRPWLDSLPNLVERCVTRWSLQIGEPYPDSFVALVLPAMLPDGTGAVLKIQFPHTESEHEADALELWAGDGAVHLLDSDVELRTLLLERCVPGTHLAEREADEALTVLTGLLPRLWKPAGEPFRRLADEAERWAANLNDRWERAGRPFERRLLDAAVGALRELGPSQGEPVLVHQDLHADNVLRAEREPWLVIDPKPLVGESELSVAPVVRSYELGHARELVLRRLDRLTADLDLDRERARWWTIAQTLAWSFEGDRVLPRHVETARWLVDSTR